MKNNCHYREREFNEIIALDAAEGLHRFTRIAQQAEAAPLSSTQFFVQEFDAARQEFNAEAALQQRQAPAQQCVGCEGKPSAENSPCGVCGLRHALEVAEAALADIGDADREPGDDLAWCEARAAKALPEVRAALAQQAEAAPVASCPDPSSMGEHACHNQRQCWEPCGALGKDASHATPAPTAEPVKNGQQEKAAPPFAAPASQHDASEAVYVGNSGDVVVNLREYAANPGFSHNDYADTMRQAANVIEHLRAQFFHLLPAQTVVSPAPVTAEPAQSIDTPEFRELMVNFGYWVDEGEAERDECAADLIAYINRHIAPAPADRDAIPADDVQWGHDLQLRLLASSQDVTESEDARQVMAEAACCLAAITGRPVEQGMERAADAAETRDAKGDA